jgi:sorbitol-specific phosphotransferase system component IIC
LAASVNTSARSASGSRGLTVSKVQKPEVEKVRQPALHPVVGLFPFQNGELLVQLGAPQPHAALEDVDNLLDQRAARFVDPQPLGLDLFAIKAVE